MSYKKGIIYPANPNTTRGASTKLSSHGCKLVYANGRTIVIRDLEDPGKNLVYTGHLHPTTVARISPSGFYCASADSSGTVKVWDIVGEENILKIENKAITGPVQDLAWDGESKRIIAVGNGRGKFGHAFMIDSGSSCGEVTGHSKGINAISIRHQRPFRAVSASDDGSLIFLHGTPYKYNKTIRTHTKFVQDVQYAPSGDVFVSVGSDFKVFLYDGKTGEMTVDLGEKLHSGTIYAASWNKDSQCFATSSADKTVKIFDASTQKMVTSWTVGKDIPDQQCGNAWINENEIASLSLRGDINVFDKRTGDAASRILYGPTKGVTAGAVDSSGTFFAGSYDGRAISSTSNGTVQPVSGSCHSNMVSGLAAFGSDVFSVGYDDKIRHSTAIQSLNDPPSLTGQPKGVAVDQSGVAFVATLRGIDILKDGKEVYHTPVTYSPSSIAVAGDLIAVGGEDNCVHLYQWDGSKLVQKPEKLQAQQAQITAVAFSPDGSLLVSGDSNGKVFLYNLADKTAKVSEYPGPSSRVTVVSFHPSGDYLLVGSLDTNLYVWLVANSFKKVKILNACMGGVNAAAWVGGSRVASAGADASIRTWEIQLPA